MSGPPSESARKKKVRRPVPRHLPGNIARRYRVLSLLGSGGVGEVVEAYDLKGDRPVALKLLKREAARDKQVLERFFREATVLGRINHPSIVRVFDTGQDESGLYYLAMDFIQGVSLKERLQAVGRMPASEVVRLGAEVCEVMQVAHDLKIIHRDLKPSNLMVPDGWDEGQVPIKILDFGIAKIYFGDGTGVPGKLTRQGDLIGTPQYMAPEQARGRPVDGRADLYSLGCILYEMLSGHPPFGGNDHFAVLLGHMEREPVRLEDLVGADEVPAPLAELVHQLLAKDPDQRPVNAAVAEAQLSGLADSMPTSVDRRPTMSPAEFRAKQRAAERGAADRGAAERLDSLVPAPFPPSPSAEREVVPSGRMRALERGAPASDAEVLRRGTEDPTSPEHRRKSSAALAAVQPGLASSGVLGVASSSPQARAPSSPSAGTPHKGRVNRAEIATERLELPEGPSVAPEVAQEPTLEGPARAGLAGGLAFLVALVALAALVVCFLAYSLLSQDNHKPAKPTQEVGVRERDPKPLDKKDPPKPSDDPKKGDPKQADPKKADPKEPSSALVADPKQGATPTPDASAREDAKLELSSDPAGAEVWHKGRSLGVTPLTVTAAQGDAPLVYLLRAKGREARYLVVQPSDLADGQHAEQEALPKLIGGRLSNLEILSTPPGAELYDGDRYVGLTPITLSLPTSRQLVPLRLVLDERTEKTFYFALPSGDHVLKIDLKADQDPIPVPRK